MKSCAHKRKKGLVLTILTIVVLGVFLNTFGSNNIALAEGEFYSVTNASNRTSSTSNGADKDWVTTGASNTGASLSTDTITLCPGESTSLTFSHNIYSNSSANNVEWSVTRSGFDAAGVNIKLDQDGNGNSVSGQNSAQSVDGVATGSVNINEAVNNSNFSGMTASTSDGSRPYSDTASGDQSYVHRDYYNVSFDASSVGRTFNFCEAMAVGGNSVSSQACTSVRVLNCGGIPPIPYIPPVIPPDPNVTTVVAQVRNVTKGTAFSTEVYAEPGETVEWRFEYYSGVQNVANEIVSSNEHIEHNSSMSEGHYPQSNKPISEFGDWENKFTITASGFDGETVTKTFPIGQVSTEVYTNQYTIKEEDTSSLGSVLTETITSGTPSRVVIKAAENTKWNCDCKNGQCGKCDHGNSPWIESSRIGKVDASAKVIISPNYKNTANAKLENDTVFAGEVTTVKNFKIQTQSQYGGYATNVYNAKTRVYGYIATTDQGETGSSMEVGRLNLCEVLSVFENKCDMLYSDDDLELQPEGQNDLNNLLVNVYDVPAGYYFCVVGAVYPSSSGSRFNYTDPEGSHMWAVSKPSCAKVGKKPSIQVWGAGLYTANKIALPLAEKRVVSGHLNDYSPRATSNIAFGSWVEQNIVANGLIAHLASGAADGMAGSMASRTMDGLDGSYSNSALGTDIDCVLSPLTMPNDKCSVVSNPGGTAGSMNKPTDKSAITARFVDGNNADFMVHNECSISGTPSFAEKKTHVYKCDDKFTISGDVAYFDNTYTSLIDVPKIIIHAKNIEIGCGVSQVDAVLIADDTVNTCNNDDVNSIERANQLVINGSVIANKMVANRTYGGARGTNSGVPAEIVNYDTSLYLWGSPRADVSGSGKLETVYQTELSPRF